MTSTRLLASARLARTIAAVAPLDLEAMDAAAARLDTLTKPPGSLGRLETLAIRLAGITGRPVPRISHPAVAVFAGDHGVAGRGVSPYPSEVTRQMVANFLAGGAAINVLSRVAGADLVVVDVGVAGAPFEPGPPAAADAPRFVAARVASGTRDFSRGPAMTAAETLAAIEVGIGVVEDLVATGVDLIAVGEMGIANTTASSAIVATLTRRTASDVTGRGTGLDDAGVRRKAAVIDEALALHRLDPEDPLAVLAAVGGLEIAAVVGAILAGGAARIPVLLDGFITGAAALVAAGMAPAVPARLIASHRSAERGHAIVLEALGLEPVLELDLRLGEGSGAALAIPIVVAAARIMSEMATFADAGIANRD